MVKKSGKSFLRELRDAYPTMPIQQFAEIVDSHRESDDLLEHLDHAELAAVTEKEQGERKLEELQKKLSASEQHYLLRFMVPADIDLEHAQAILMYGFLMPGQEKCFIGSKMLPAHHVRENVRNKLGVRFSSHKYDAAFTYIKKEGVLKRHSSGGQEEALSLKSSRSENGGTTEHGAQILHVALEFARQKKVRK